MSFNKTVIHNLKIRVEIYNKDAHQEIVKSFECGKETINHCLYNASELDATTMLFFNNSNNELIGYCSFCCSSILIEDEIDEETYAECYPAMEIKLFGIKKSYQGHKLVLDGQKYSIAIFIFKYILKHLKDIALKHIYANYIILYALPDVVGFYEKNQFEQLSSKHEVLSGYFEDGCCPMYLHI